jgi:glycosyltransferase involved in cell wall biosynthesis
VSDHAEERLALAFVGQGWFPDAGGVESHTRDLARELRSRGHRVRALCLDRSEGLEPYTTRESLVEGVALTRMAYRYHDHRALADLVESPRANAIVLRWLAAERTDLVHVHHASGFGLGILGAIRGAGTPLALTLHDYWPLCPRGQMVQPDGTVDTSVEPERCGRCLAATWPHLMPSGSGERRGPHGQPVASDAEAAGLRTAYALERLAACDRLFTPSAAAREVYVQAGIARERIQVVENGVDVDALLAEVERLRRARPPRAEVRLGILGTVLPSKGALELARAFQAADVAGLALEIHGALPSYHGDSRYVEELQRLASSDPRVRIHGPYTHDRLAAILADLDGVAAPSRWCEVYGLTVREARAAGLAVLVSDAGALPDVARGGGGRVVPASEPDGWRRALAEFADPAQRARWASVERRPRDARAMAEELEQAYREMLEGRRRSSGWLRRLFRRG